MGVLSAQAYAMRQTFHFSDFDAQTWVVARIKQA